jgi:hypothetical protein
VHRAVLEEAARAQNETADFQRLALDHRFAMATSELAWLDNMLNRVSHQPRSMEVVQGN